ncbi:MAG: hypothetical protein V1813_00330 [Candidatus Aenigmatarchaeota archaeon]
MKRKMMTDDGPELADSFEVATKLVGFSRYGDEYSVERLDGNGTIRITLGNTVMETSPEMPGYAVRPSISNRARKDLRMRKSDGLPFLELTEALEVAELAHEHTLYPKDAAAYGNLIGVLSRYLARKGPDGNGADGSGLDGTNFYQ